MKRTVLSLNAQQRAKTLERNMLIVARWLGKDSETSMADIGRDFHISRQMVQRIIARYLKQTREQALKGEKNDNGK